MNVHIGMDVLLTEDVGHLPRSSDNRCLVYLE